MDLKGFVDRAKEAANTAAQKAQEAANALSAAAASASTAAPAPENAPETALQPNDEAPVFDGEDATEGTELALGEGVTLGDQPGVLAAAPLPANPAPARSFSTLANEKLNELSAVGAQKVQDLVMSFQQALPAIKSAGYEMTEFELELGVTPKLIPHFRHAAKSIEDVDAARAMLKDNKLGMMILVALLKAGEVHKQIRVAGFGFTHIEIELGLIPSVRLQYKNDLI